MTTTREAALSRLILAETFARAPDEELPARIEGWMLRLYRDAARVSGTAVAARMERSKQAVANIEQRGCARDVAIAYRRAVDAEGTG